MGAEAEGREEEEEDEGCVAAEDDEEAEGGEVDEEDEEEDEAAFPAAAPPDVPTTPTWRPPAPPKCLASPRSLKGEGLEVMPIGSFGLCPRLAAGKSPDGVSRSSEST